MAGPEKADAHFEKALMIMSAYAKKAANLTAKKFYLKFEKEILFDWAQNDWALGRWRQSLGKLKQGTVIDGKDATLYNNMAFAYLHLGDRKDAYLKF